MQMLQHRLIHRLEVRFFFFNSLMTVLGLTCNTRAVSRMPLAFRAISTICRLISGDWPSVGIRQEKRASVIRARPAPISLLPLPCRAVPHNIRALTVGTMENLAYHAATRSRWGFSASTTFDESSRSTPLEHLPAV